MPKSKNSVDEGLANISQDIQVNIKTHLKLILIFMLIWLTISSAGLYYKSTYHYPTQVAFKYFVANFLTFFWDGTPMRFFLENGGIEYTTAGQIAFSENIKQMAMSQFPIIVRIVVCFLLMVFVCYPLTLDWLRSKPRKKILRGPFFISPLRYTCTLKFKKKDKCGLNFGSIPMGLKSEGDHLRIFGKSGTGKSQLISQFLPDLIERNEKIIVHDPKREYLSKFYNPKKDFIFNPLDERSLHWDIFSDIKSIYDVEAIAASLIPIDEKKDDFWNSAARQIFSGILHALYSTGQQTNQDIYELTTSDPVKIKEAMDGIEEAKTGYSHIVVDDSGKISRQTEGIIGTLKRYTHFLRYMKDRPKNKNTFSIRNWLQSGIGTIYLTNHAKTEDTLKPVFSLFVDFMSKSLLSLKDDLKRKIFFVVDEFGAMNRMPAIISLLKEGRSKGARIFLAAQEFSQIDQIYSESERHTIVNNCGSSVTFAVKDEYTAKIASDNIGEIEYIEKEHSRDKNGKLRSIRSTTKRGPLVIPAEIMGQKKLNAIVHMQGYNPVYSDWDIVDLKDKNKDFIQKEGLDMNEIYKTEKIMEEENKVNKNIEMEIDKFKKENTGTEGKDKIEPQVNGEMVADENNQMEQSDNDGRGKSKIKDSYNPKKATL